MTSRLETWRPAADWPGCDRDVIDVWRCALRAPAEVLAARHALLTAGEQARAARFRRDVDRAAYVVVRARLRERLAACLGMAPAAVPLTETAHGKPVLAGPEPRWECNVSHSGEIGLVAVAWARAVGVDVEAHRATVDGPALARRYFSPRECAALEAMPPEARERGFYAVWTRKEAFLKATGQGLSFPLDKFSVTAAPDEAPRLLELEGESAPERRWRLWNVEIGPGYSAALAVAVGDGSITLRGWQ